MSRFWIACIAVFSTAFAGIFFGPRPLRSEPYPLWGKALGYTIAGTMVGVIWAICFRPQVERGRASLFSIFCLVAMEALLFWFIRHVGTFGPE